MGSWNQDYGVCMGKKTNICKGMGGRGDRKKRFKILSKGRSTKKSILSVGMFM
jgi:hypothetical protein